MLVRGRIIETLQDWGRPALTFVGLVVAWEVVARVLHVPVWLVPAPSEIVSALIARGPNIFFHTWITFYETLLGFLVAIALGVPLAVAVTYSRALSNTIYPLILVTQSIPKVAFAPILLIWFGYGDLPKIVVAFLVAFFALVVDTPTRLRSPGPPGIAR
jgi:NitT/TauT family transport system permease protein